ncbi:MAG TPA: chemotaxis protein CheW [Syntrophomonadaceae bacterium]|nr:chemotaxis protein CheW [Syntrophomonadaceae bacterium]
MNNTADHQNEEVLAGEEEIQVVAFQLGKEEYAVDILNVQEIIGLLNITRVPRSDKYLEGVVNLRGNIIPVINLHTKFNLASAGDKDDKRIIVFQFEDVRAGIIVDEVSEVLRINTRDIETATYQSMDATMIKGIAKVGERLLILLDLQRILGLEAV